MRFHPPTPDGTLRGIGLKRESPVNGADTPRKRGQGFSRPSFWVVKKCISEY
jgi:hypothetical protein